MDKLFNDPKMLQKCLDIFSESIKCLSNYSDFSTYLFTLEKLIKEFNFKILSEILNLEENELNQQIKNIYLNFLKSIFKIEIKKSRLNKLYISLINSIFEQFNKKTDEGVFKKVSINVIEICFLFNNLKNNNDDYNVNVYSEENDALFIRFYLNFYDWIEKGIVLNNFEMISSLFYILINNFEIFNNQNDLLNKLNKRIYQIEINIISKILNYLTCHISSHLKELGDYYFFTSFIFLHKLRFANQNIQLLFKDQFSEVVNELYIKLSNLVSDHKKEFIESQNIECYNLFLYKMIKFLIKNIVDIISLKHDNNWGKFILTFELNHALTLFLQIDCTEKLNEIFFKQELDNDDNNQEQLSSTNKHSKKHLLLIYNEITNLIINENDSKIRLLCSEFFKILYSQFFQNSENTKKSYIDSIFNKSLFVQSYIDENSIFQPKLLFQKFDKQKLNLYSQKLKIFLEENEENGISKEKFNEIIKNEKIDNLLQQELIFIL